MAARFPRHDIEVDAKSTPMPQSNKNDMERKNSHENSRGRLLGGHGSMESVEYLDLLPPKALREEEHTLSALMVHSRQAYCLMNFMKLRPLTYTGAV